MTTPLIPLRVWLSSWQRVTSSTHSLLWPPFPETANVSCTQQTSVCTSVRSSNSRRCQSSEPNPRHCSDPGATSDSQATRSSRQTDSGLASCKPANSRKCWRPVASRQPCRTSRKPKVAQWALMAPLRGARTTPFSLPHTAAAPPVAVYGGWQRWAARPSY